MNNTKILNRPRNFDMCYYPPDVDRRPLPSGLITPMTPEGLSIERQKGYPEQGKRDIPPVYSSAAIYISKSLHSIVKSITTTAALILKPRYTSSLLIVNPNRALGQTSRVTGMASTTLTATTNTQSSYIDVTAYTEAHLFLNITAITGTWDVYAQGYDALSGNWYNTQRVFPALTATTHSGYTMIGPGFVSDRLAFNFDQVAAGNITCSLGVVLKVGYGYSLSNYSLVAYIGGPGVSTTNGFPILPGEYQQFVVGENVEIYGVATATTELRIFEL